VKLKNRLLAAQEVLLCAVRKWWRPLMLVGVAVATWVNLVLIPLVKWEVPNLTEAAAWIAACGALQWVREWGKVKGTDAE
jgi:hypothetical protein